MIGRPASGPESLAVDDAHAAPPAASGVIEKAVKGHDRVSHDPPMQIEVRFDLEPGRAAAARSRAAGLPTGEAQYVARPDVRGPLRFGKLPELDGSLRVWPWVRGALPVRTGGARSSSMRRTSPVARRKSSRSSSVMLPRLDIVAWVVTDRRYRRVAVQPGFTESSRHCQSCAVAGVVRGPARPADQSIGAAAASRASTASRGQLPARGRAGRRRGGAFEHRLRLL